eukprot:11788080-Prorocentrum_lima.AAC.1
MADDTRDRLHGVLKRLRPGEWSGQRFLRGKYVDDVTVVLVAIDLNAKPSGYLVSRWTRSRFA